MVENASTGAPHKQLVASCEPKTKKKTKSGFLSFKTAFFVLLNYIF